MGTIYLFLADGFEEVEALAPVDVCRRAGLKITTVSIMGTLTVHSSHGVGVLADALFETCNFADAEMLVLPGGMPGATNLGAHAGLHREIERMAGENKPLTAICAAPMVLGEMGLLKGVKATCCPGFEGYMKGATYTASLVEKDGNYITGCGPAASFELGFAIVEKYLGRAKADELRSKMRFTR